MNFLLLHFVAALALTAITTLVLGAFVFFRKPRKAVNRTFALYSLTIAWWSFCQIWLVANFDRTQALLWARIEQIGVFFIPTLFLHFVLSLLEAKGRQRVLVFGYALSLLFGTFSLSSYMMADAVQKFYVRYFATPGNLYTWAVSFFVAYVVYALYLLYREYISTSGMRRNQIKYLFWSSLSGYLGGGANFLLVYDIYIPGLSPFGTYAVPLYVLVTAYAIVRYRLLDITVALTRTSVLIGVYGIVVGVPLAIGLVLRPALTVLFGTRWWLVPLGLYTGAAFVGPFVYLFFQRKAEDRLLREQRRYQASLLQASYGMTQIRELKRLLDLIVHVVTKTVGLTHAAIFLYDPKAEAFGLKASRRKALLSTRDRLAKNDPLIRFLARERQPLVLAELTAQLGDAQPHTAAEQDQQHVVDAMRALHAGVVVPSFLQEELLGLLVLGEKRTGQIFTTEDLNVFSTLANQAALAVENAQFYEELQSTQAQLFQAAKMASLGQMGAGMSHQINNRFQALLGASGELLHVKLPKLLAEPHWTPEQRTTLEAFADSLRSIEEEAKKGGEIVQRLTRYARVSKGATLLSPAEIVSGAVSMVQYKVNLGEVAFVNGLPGTLPKVRGSLSQLQDVFFNLIDNAYDAIKAKEFAQRQGKLPPEPGFRGAIAVGCRVLEQERQVELSVQDNGSGMNPDEMEQLFVPFFTTKATAEKGTGLGLFVIKKIIEAHEGTIGIASRHGEGTTFTIRLPIAQEGTAA